MTSDLGGDQERDRRVGEVLAAYLGALDAGLAPGRDALLREHPELVGDRPSRADSPAPPPQARKHAQRGLNTPHRSGAHSDQADDDRVPGRSTGDRTGSGFKVRDGSDSSR